MAGGRRRGHRRAAPLRVPGNTPAPAGGHGGLQPGRGGGHRPGREGDVHLRRSQGQVPLAPARGDCELCAGLHRERPVAQPDATAVVPRPDVPLRTSAEGTHAGTHPDRGGGVRHSRAGSGRGDPGHAGACIPRTGRRERGLVGNQQPRLRRIQDPVPGGAGGLPIAARERIGCRQSPAPGHQSAAHPRQQGRDNAGHRGRGTGSRGLPGRRRPRALRRVARPA